jgi:hypothetical protein
VAIAPASAGEGSNAVWAWPRQSELGVQPQSEYIDRAASVVIGRVLGELIIRTQLQVFRDLPVLIRCGDPLRAVVEGSVADGNSQATRRKVLPDGRR